MSADQARVQAEAHLSLAEKHLIEGQQRVDDQRLRIEEARRNGVNIESAEKYLATLEEIMTTWREHRNLIVARLAALDAAEAERLSRL
ncbi:hypothetical protein [Methylobacterium sp. ID0610]|uniref:hypothetical protein n=1 Tax=Methylobacterium carpenticola TaxID=3344827 RepID=UPI0036A531E1